LNGNRPDLPLSDGKTTMRIVHGFRPAACLTKQSALFYLLFFYCFTYALPSDSVGRTTATYGSGSNVILNVYQRWISPVKGGNTCPMYPSCSQYAKILFEREVFPLAVAGTCDRLLRCGRDPGSYARVDAEGSTKMYDPPVVAQQTALPEKASAMADAITAGKPATEPCDISYAAALSGSGLHGIAFREYLRAAMLCSQDTLRRTAFAGAIRSAYYSMGGFEFVDFYHSLISRVAGDTSLACYLHLAVARKQCCTGDFSRALRTLRLCQPIPQGSSLWDEYCFLRSIAELRLFEWNKAALSADSINAASSKSALRKITGGFAVRPPILPHRERFVSAVLSAMIPGAGYVYTGRPSTGIAAFVVNGLFIWSAVEMFRAHHIAAGTTVSLIGCGWYFGTIRGSVSSTDRFNFRVKNDYVDELLDGIDFESCPGFAE
jgi:putative component of membrane protein insertase Oxa1/YidC/SpoIIIJ protein YidD